MNKIEELIQQLCPEGVVYKELGEMTKILNGYAFKSNKYTSSGIRVIRISDVQKGKMSDKDLKYYPIEMMDEFKSYILKENDLVMSLTGNVGRVAMISERHLPAGLNQRVACIRTKNKEILTRFLFHFFDQNQFEIDAMTNATGGGQKNMSTTWLAKYMIPIPPLPVQQEIVTILDTFTELEAELEARKKQYEYYRNELLTFGDEVEWKTLGDICDIYDGTHQTPKYTNSGVPFVSVQNINNIYGTEKYISLDDFNKYKYKPRKDDLFMTRIGDIGTCALVENDDPLAYYVTLTLIRMKHRVILPRFLKHIIESNIGKSELYKRTLVNAVPIKINLGDIGKITIPIPPLAEQERIAGILDKFDALVNDISIGLPAEIEARRKQYEYYREKLLSFDRAE